MKKLSDYRIKEVNGNFIMETKAESEMKGIIDTELAQVKKSFQCFPCDLSDIAKTEQQMKEEIAEQDVVGACKKQFDDKLPSFEDCGRKSLCALSDEAPDTLFINEALEINPYFYKLVEEYEEKVKTGWNPKTIEKSDADLFLENFELTIKNKELEIQLHELKRKQTKEMTSAENPFTKEENEIMNYSIEIWNKFINLEEMHSCEKQEMMTAIHQIQSIMSHRSLKRLYPKYFR